MEYLISLKIRAIIATPKLILSDHKLCYKSFALHRIQTNISYMNRFFNTESNGGIFIDIRRALNQIY